MCLIIRIIGKTGIDPTLFTFGEIFLIGKEYNFQKQIDRACSAQSPDMLPETNDSSKLQDAQERVKKQKKQYTKPSDYKPVGEE